MTAERTIVRDTTRCRDRVSLRTSVKLFKNGVGSNGSSCGSATGGSVASSFSCGAVGGTGGTVSGGVGGVGAVGGSGGTTFGSAGATGADGPGKNTGGCCAEIFVFEFAGPLIGSAHELPIFQFHFHPWIPVSIGWAIPLSVVSPQVQVQFHVVGSTGAVDGADDACAGCAAAGACAVVGGL